MDTRPAGVFGQDHELGIVRNPSGLCHSTYSYRQRIESRAENSTHCIAHFRFVKWRFDFRVNIKVGKCSYVFIYHVKHVLASFRIAMKVLIIFTTKLNTCACQPAITLIELESSRFPAWMPVQLHVAYP